MKHTEEVVKAWGIRYETYKNHIDSKGWILNKYLGNSIFVLTEPFEKNYKGNKSEDFNHDYVAFRPSVLNN